MCFSCPINKLDCWGKKEKHCYGKSVQYPSVLGFASRKNLCKKIKVCKDSTNLYSSARKVDDKCGMLVCVSYGKYVVGGNVVTITHQRPCLLVLAPNFSPQLMFSYTSYLGGGRITNEATTFVLGIWVWTPHENKTLTQ